MGDDWAEKRVREGEVLPILKFYARLRNMLGDEDKTFSLAPVHDVARRFISVDTTVLFWLMRHAELYQGTNVGEFQGDATEHFHEVFKIKAPRRCVFTNFLQTDGVSIVFHFRRPKRGVPSTGKKKREKVERQWGDVGVDTGLVNLIYAARENEDGTFDEFQLKKSKHYSQSGINERTRKAKTWCAEVAEEHALLATVSPKAKDMAGFRAYLAVAASVHDKLWELKLRKKWARASLRVYGGKMRSLDGFFNEMKAELGPNAALHWGDASVNSSMKGTKPAPTTSLLRRARLHFKHINLVDEYRTSKVCHCCDEVIHKVTQAKRDREGELRTREVRGLRWCSTSRRFLDRDFNAAVNILRCGVNGRRTENMTRDSEKATTSGGQKSFRLGGISGE
jgi:hypothetical protein